MIALALSGVSPLGASAQEDVPTLTAENATASLLEDPRIGTEILRLRTNSNSSVLRAKQGVPFKLRFVNTLPQEVALRFFGVRGPEDAMNVTLSAKSGDVDPWVEVNFTPQDAGTFWIGPAQNARELRDRGLVAMFIVEEAQSAVLVDVPLIIDDWMIDGNGKLDADYSNLERLISQGRVGNWLTVNSQFKPRISVLIDGPVRLRILNAANMRVMKLALRGGDPLVLALDGQPLPVMRPVGNEAILLAPGQRVDLLLPASSGTVALTADLDADTVETVFFEPSIAATVEELPDNFRLPPNPLTTMGAEARTVPLAIEGGAQGGLTEAQVGIETLELRQMLERGLAWALNGVAGPGGPVLFNAAKGETLLLEVENKTAFEQVLGITGHVWHMVELNGAVVDFQPRRDTAVIPAKSIAKLMMVANNPGLWTIQSMQADRADGGLLGSFQVEAELP